LPISLITVRLEILQRILGSVKHNLPQKNAGKTIAPSRDCLQKQC